MSLTRLQIVNLRNIKQVSFVAASDLNVIYGANGSGKTSLLEAIHILGSGKSFRSNAIRNVINIDAESLVVYGEVVNGCVKRRIGIERQVGQSRFRIDGQPLPSIVELVAQIPLQFFGPDLQKLLEQAPRLRRSLLDWGVFHVEHDFFKGWSRYNKLLKHRNALLKRRSDIAMIRYWDHELVRAAEQINAARSAYLERLIPVFNDYLAELIPLESLNYHYSPGWNREHSLEQLLAENLQRDIKRGFTQSGPHRADLVFRIGNQPVSEVLSRGQLKLIVVALKLAQVKLLQDLHQKDCVILIDDLPAELDRINRKRVLSHLLQSKAQVFITCTDPSLLEFAGFTDGCDKKTFHVEHGLISEVL